MKRFWTTPAFVRQQRIRRRKADRRKTTYAAERRKRARNWLYSSTEFSSDVIELTPPVVLSIVERPEDSLKFCERLQAGLRRRRSVVSIDLRDVTRISSDALLLMRAIIDDAKGIYRSVGGPLPNDKALTAKIKQSGFFKGFSNPPADLPVATGLIVRKSQRKVDSEVAAQLVQFAIDNASVPQAVAEASYKNLVELMGNTHNHAARRGRRGPEGQQPWQATVYCEDGVAYFTFVDLGVGILRSPAPRNVLRRIGTSLLTYGQPKLLCEIFQGIIGASADVPGRGFGLQRMMALADARLLPALRVVTGSVAGEVSGMRFESIGVDFHGTLFRWTTRTESTE